MVVVKAEMEGLHSKVQSLFNNKMFSDVEFTFDGDNIKLYGHKLILALRSDYFASIFYENTESILKIKLPADGKCEFITLLKFMYTDELELQFIKEAQCLSSLAKRYGIKELETKCVSFILRDDIDLNNLFIKYEFALTNSIDRLLNACRKFTCELAEMILNSCIIYNVSADILVDILKLQNLSVSSEMVVLKAILQWGKVKCIADGKPSDNMLLKTYIYPFLKHIRFLTLTDSEFHSFLEEFDLLTALESSILTRKILRPHLNIKVPEHLCDINYKRGTLLQNEISSSQKLLRSCDALIDQVSKAYSLTDLETDSVSSSHSEASHSYKLKNSSVADNSPQNNLSHHPKAKQPYCIGSSDESKPIEYTVQECVSSKSLSLSSTDPLLIKNTLTNDSTSKPKEILLSKTDLSNRHKLDDMLALCAESIWKNSKEIKLNNRHSVSETSSKALDSDSNQASGWQNKSPENEMLDDRKKFAFEIKKQHSFERSKVPISKTGTEYSRSTLQPSITRTFDFCLCETEPGLHLSFKRDVKCSVSFNMKVGQLKISGFELYIKNSSPGVSEKINLDVDLRGFTESLFTKSELKNNVMTVEFNYPIVIQSKKGQLEVSVDDFCCNRSRVCKTTALEIKSGHNWVCELNVKSNIKSQNDALLFLINRLFYTV